MGVNVLPKILSISDQEYLNALKEARIAIITGGQSYRIGSRALTRADLRFITDEIDKLEGKYNQRWRRVLVRDL